MSLWQLCTAVWRKGERMSDTEAVFRLLCMMCSLIHYKETESSFACMQPIFCLHSLSNQISPSEELGRGISPVIRVSCTERKRETEREKK